MIVKTQINEMFVNKNVLILGLGLSGLSCVRFLTKMDVKFAVNDSRNSPVNIEQFNKEYPLLKLSLGQWDAELIAAADIIITSPGIDLNDKNIATHINDKCQIWGDVELFFQIINQHNIVLPTLAVTGSNGKSTVVSLLAHIGKKLGLNICLAGNIGLPIVDMLAEDNLEQIDCLVLELSSFQLETLRSMNALGVSVLNISDDHLDRHKTLENYQHIKHNIYHQGQTLVFNRDDQLTLPLAVNNDQTLVSFGSDNAKDGQFGLLNNKQALAIASNSLIALNQLPMSGTHNALNCLAALALGQSAGWNMAEMVNVLGSFVGLEHRCQIVPSNDGIIWINDSKATNVGATLAAIEGLVQTKKASQKLILIAGGEGKGADFSPLKIAINNNVAQLITLGKDGDKLADLTDKSISVTSLQNAVDTASALARNGDIVLLSPACASLDMFSNFVERGNAFIAAVLAVQKEITPEKNGVNNQ